MARAIKSILANRKLFQGGGLVPPGNPMQNLNQANGILASSQPLIDSVANDAVNPQGGRTLSMDSGGIAKFHRGGGVHTHPHRGPQSYRPGIGMGRRVKTGTYPAGYPNVTPAQWRKMVQADPSLRDTPQAGHYEYVNPATPDESYAMAFPPTTTREPGTATLDIGPIKGLQWSQTEGATTSPAEARYNMMFPYSAEVDTGLSSMNPPLEENLVSQESWFGEGAPSRAEVAASLPLHVMKFLGELGTRLTYHGGKQLKNSMDFMLQKTGPEGFFDATSWGKISALTTMTAAQPDYAVELGQISDALMATEEGKNMSPDEYRLAISETFYNQKTQEAASMQGIPQEGRVTDLPDITPAEEIIADTSRQTQQDARVTILGEKGLADDLRTYQGMMDSPDQQLAFIQELTASKGSGYVQNLLARVDEVGDQEIAIAEAPVVAGGTPETAIPVPEITVTEEAEAGPTQRWPGAEVVEAEVTEPPEKTDATLTDADPGAEALSALEAAQPVIETKPSAGDIVDDGSAKGAANRSRADRDAASIAEVANTDDQKDLNSKIQSYVDEFKSAIPDYEGKSEYEKGMDIVKMGMAIAAGQSPNAITNISKGVLATIDNFTDDEKDKREYARQVGLSAGKYAIESVRKDRDAAAADLRKANWLAFSEDYTDPVTGKEYERGEAFRMSDADYLAGNFTSYPLGLPSIVEAQIDAEVDSYEALVAANSAFATDKQIGSKGMATLRASQLDHAEALTGVRNGHILVGLLDSIIISNVGEDGKSKITGAYPWMKDKIDSLANAFDDTFLGDLDKLKYTDLKQYDTRLQFVANRMIKELLGEGSRNISNIDRTLAEQIVGLLKNRSTIFASPEVMHENLQRIRGQLMQGIVDKYNTIDREENNWMERNFVGREEGPTHQMIRERERALEGSLEGFKSGRTGEEIVIDYKRLVDPESGRLIKNWEELLRS